MPHPDESRPDGGRATIPARVAVFVSGRGSNLQALLDRFNGAVVRDARVEIVVASPGGAEAMERARAAKVDAIAIDTGLPQEAQAASILPELEARSIDLVVLAGYVKLVPASIVERFRGRILNIHPALLPAFGGAGMYGIRVHRAVLASGARVTGATIHMVDERYDEGGIVAQWPVPVLSGDTPETLAARVLRVEHMILPAAIEMVLGRVAPGLAPDSAAFHLSRDPSPSDGSIREFLSISTRSNDADRSPERIR